MGGTQGEEPDRCCLASADVHDCFYLLQREGLAVAACSQEETPRAGRASLMQLCASKRNLVRVATLRRKANRKSRQAEFRKQAKRRDVALRSSDRAREVKQCDPIRHKSAASAAARTKTSKTERKYGTACLPIHVLIQTTGMCVSRMMAVTSSSGRRPISRLRRPPAMRRGAGRYHDRSSEPTASTRRDPSCASRPSPRVSTPPMATDPGRHRLTAALSGDESATQTVISKRRGPEGFASIGWKFGSTTERLVSEILC